MTSITRFRFIPDTNDPSLRPLSGEEYQAARSHGNRPVKDRSEMERFPRELTAARIKDLHPGQLPPRRQFVLRPSHDLKAVAYNARENSSPASTGTSQTNVVCLTDGMGPCIAVAIGGERMGAGVSSLGAKVRVFHVFPDNVDVSGSLGDYVRRLQRDGLHVRAALHGGENDLEKSRQASSEIRSLLQGLGVQVEFDEACERRDGLDTLLGAVIDDEHKVDFVTELAQRL